MGTTYHVQIIAADVDNAQITLSIEQVLEGVDAEMSTYREDSTLSRFNVSQPQQWFPVSSAIVALVRKAAKWHELSAGAFDITVGPIVNLWGFGPEQMEAMPDAKAVAEVLDRVGQQGLSLRENPPALYKSKDLYVDLSAIAKGYAVDLIADSLEARGFDRYLIEVGGEVRVRGHNAQGEAWSIGVERPDERSASVALSLIGLTEGAVATSGDYRNFFEYKGQRYSHMLDARTGYPVQSQLASVTVWAAQATDADGWATLLGVSGYEAGFALAESQGVAALFILRSGQGFIEKATSHFDAITAN